MATRLVCDGDSLTVGIASTPYPTQIAALLGGTWNVSNTGISAQTLQDMIDSASDVDSLYSGSNTANWVICFGGTNDIYFGATADTAISRMTTYVTARKSAGFSVAVCTILPRNDFPGTSTLPDDKKTNHELRRQAFNNTLRSTLAGADRLIDFASDTRIGDNGDENNTTYYGSDLVHPTTAGNALLADRAFRALIPVSVAWRRV